MVPFSYWTLFFLFISHWFLILYIKMKSILFITPSYICVKQYFFFIFFHFLTLQYCIGFAIYQHESAMGIHVLPILNPPRSSLPVPWGWCIGMKQYFILSGHEALSVRKKFWIELLSFLIVWNQNHIYYKLGNI